MEINIFGMGLTSINSAEFIFLFVERLFFSSNALCDWHFEYVIQDFYLHFLPSLLFDISLLQLINMTHIFLFWATYHVNKSSNPFRDHTILPKHLSFQYEGKMSCLHR